MKRYDFIRQFAGIVMRAGALVALFGVATAAQGQDDPSSGLRDFTTDRPDKTESPQTVDAGHIQVELDLVSHVHDRADDVSTDTLSAVPFNLKYGIDRSTDLQLIVSPYLRQTIEDRQTGMKTRTAGFGDVSVRLKHNLWGNDGGKTALALMPFVTLPTADDGLGVEDVEFGLIVPLSVQLSDIIDLGLMTEVDGRSEDGHYHASYINSATVSFDLQNHLGVYTEIYTEHDREWIITADTGITYGIGENAQIDLGVNVGLSDAADDLGVFIGYSRRF